MNLTIIGIDDKKPVFNKELKQLISQTRNHAGGKRHFELVKAYLPDSCNWLTITAPLDDFIFSLRQKEKWIVFASGDPLFFGIGNTLKNHFPDVEINIYPTFNSLQLLAHRFKLPYGEHKIISLTGRPWGKFDEALIRGIDKIGLLTDRKKTPNEIAVRMINYGYSNYKMFYGEYLGGEREKVKELSLNEAKTMNFNHPNCMFLQKTDGTIPQKALPEAEFATLPGRPNMITKMPYRLTTLALMELNNKNVFWDIGACTGSVSIEAKLNHPHLQVVAFEIRENCRDLIKRNTQKFQCPGIKVEISDFLKVEKKNYDKPDAVFVGGHGNQLEIILNETNKYLAINGSLAINTVKAESKERFLNWCTTNNYFIKHCHVLSYNAFNPVNIIVAEKR